MKDVCEICGEVKPLVRDRVAETGKLAGWLCRKCKRGIDAVRSHPDPNFLEKALKFRFPGSGDITVAE